MITIQKVSEALHEIETQVFKNDAINPFQKNIAQLLGDIRECRKDFDMRSNKETAIKLAASLTILISELP